jgi:hypothetical protein
MGARFNSARKRTAGYVSVGYFVTFRERQDDYVDNDDADDNNKSEMMMMIINQC